LLFEKEHEKEGLLNMSQRTFSTLLDHEVRAVRSISQYGAFPFASTQLIVLPVSLEEPEFYV
jgi:hypothetical protein